MKQVNGSTAPTLTGAAQLWQTPATPKGGLKSRGGGRKNELLLAGQAEATTTMWQTPTATDGHKGGPNNRHSDGIPKLSGQAAQFWATPNAHDGRRPGADMHSTQSGNLSRDAAQWPTPTSRDYRTPNSAESQVRRNPNGGEKLPNFIAHNWPTPTAMDSEQSGSANANHKTLHRATSTWPTPAASDSTRGGQQTSRMTGQTLVQTVNSLCSRPVLSIHDGAELSPTTRTLRQRLNPAFACWLMGWPTWWTNPGRISFAASEMALWRSKLLLDLSRLLGERALHEEKEHEQAA
ncbi:hypothetical protein [Chromobacterium alkanivorans]|uniref:hypothetical protein n=1 Tax=Chromobacterium alkanivorans TaxID=1071719 RepID=UPI001F07B965|nr:hypothetical protein [Chromobacterium alkanivorans]